MYLVHQLSRKKLYSKLTPLYTARTNTANAQYYTNQKSLPEDLLIDLTSSLRTLLTS